MYNESIINYNLFLQKFFHDKNIKLEDERDYFNWLFSYYFWQLERCDFKKNVFKISS